MKTIYKAKVAFRTEHLLDVREVVVDFDEGDELDESEGFREIRFGSLGDLTSDKEICSACRTVRSGPAACESKALSCSWRPH